MKDHVHCFGWTHMLFWYILPLRVKLTFLIITLFIFAGRNLNAYWKVFTITLLLSVVLRLAALTSPGNLLELEPQALPQTY